MQMPDKTKSSESREAAYEIHEGLEIHPLEAASLRHDYVVRTPENRSFVISDNLRRVLLLFQGGRTCSEVARDLSESHGTKVSSKEVREVVHDFLTQNGLLVRAGEGHTRDGRAEERKRRRSPFDFAFRIPLLQPEVVEPICRRLLWLYRRPVVWAALAVILFSHAAFYLEWFAPRPSLSFSAGEILLLYAIALGTVLFHEFGHATACRRYDCPHGPIGFTVYLIFPALYVDLSQAWRLSGRQRAVIDIGGIYFQLLTVSLLYALLLATGSSLYCSSIYAVDSMVLFALNPIFKFDGYWLMVDLSGFVNLQKRVWKVMGEILRWTFGLAQDVPSLKDVRGRGRRIFLAAYSAVTILIFAVFICLLVVIAPNRVGGVIQASGELSSSLSQGAPAVALGVLKVAGRLLFLFILARLLFRLFQPGLARLKKLRLKGERSP